MFCCSSYLVYVLLYTYICLYMTNTLNAIKFICYVLVLIPFVNSHIYCHLNTYLLYKGRFANSILYVSM